MGEKPAYGWQPSCKAFVFFPAAVAAQFPVHSAELHILLGSKCIALPLPPLVALLTFKHKSRCLGGCFYLQIAFSNALLLTLWLAYLSQKAIASLINSDRLILSGLL
jgi:hypothetical protein